MVTPYALRMAILSAKIFSEPSPLMKRNSYAKLMRLLMQRPPNKDPYMSMNYYPRYQEMDLLLRGLRDYGLFRDEHRDFYEEMERLRQLRGKGKPKRGMGKQALKRAADSE